jgi:hypothetical protein
MSEQLPVEKQKTKVTPLDLANAALQRKGIEASKPIQGFPKAGDVVERDGVKKMYVPQFFSSKKVVEGKLIDVRLPYTYRQYYSHSFFDEGTRNAIPAPGWDYVFSLHNRELTQNRHGRTFSEEELKDLPNNLPEEEALFLRPIDDYDVEEYLESLKS